MEMWENGARFRNQLACAAELYQLAQQSETWPRPAKLDDDDSVLQHPPEAGV